MTAVAEQDLAMEHKILTRLPDDVSAQQFLVKLACQADMVAMFPTMSVIAQKMLLLPIGTATVECRALVFDNEQDPVFRTLSADRRACQRVDARCIEGPPIPQLRCTETTNEYDEVLQEAYRQWMRKPRRIN